MTDFDSEFRKYFSCSRMLLKGRLLASDQKNTNIKDVI